MAVNKSTNIEVEVESCVANDVAVHHELTSSVVNNSINAEGGGTSGFMRE